MKKPELLAPAGDLERCKVAIRYGADAVYIGGKSFSLRARASNFTMDDIREAVAYANQHNARIHVTVNMIPHDEDFEGLIDYLQQLETIGVTAIIVASPAIMALAHEHAPKLEVHCSTQFSVTNHATVAFLKKQLNVDRVVLARECSLASVEQICDLSDVEVEAFIHGGMCVNYSGRCTLSNRMTLRDANRGGCAQSCRWFYHLYENNNEIQKENLFTMGSKDLCGLDAIYDLMRVGVDSFKIEGRMKTEYYVASIVSLYRRYIDEVYENQAPLNEERRKAYKTELTFIENRLVWDGFYQNTTGNESLILTPNSNQEVNHSYIGRVVDYQDGMMYISTRNPFACGDVLEVMHPRKENQRFTVEEIRNEKEEYLEHCNQPMVVVKVPVPFAVEKDDFIRSAYV